MEEVEGVEEVEMREEVEMMEGLKDMNGMQQDACGGRGERGSRGVVFGKVVWGKKVGRGRVWF